jgi:hypothetical protein
LANELALVPGLARRSTCVTLIESIHGLPPHLRGKTMSALDERLVSYGGEPDILADRRLGVGRYLTLAV